MGVSDIRFVFIFFPLALLGKMLFRGRAGKMALVLTGVVVFGTASPAGLIFALLLFVFTVQICHVLDGNPRYSQAVLLAGILGIVIPLVVLRFSYGRTSLFSISFFALSCAACMADVYRTGKEGEDTCYMTARDLALYCFYPPRLFFGPPVSPRVFLNEYREGQRPLSVEKLFSGAFAVSCGLAKIILPGRGLIAVSHILADIKNMSVAGAWATVILYGGAVWIILSGLSDTATGFSQMLGVRIAVEAEREKAGTYMTVCGFFASMQKMFRLFVTDYIFEPLADFLYRKMGVAGTAAKSAAMFLSWLTVLLFFARDGGWILAAVLLSVFAAAEEMLSERRRGLPRIFSVLYRILGTAVVFALMAGGSIHKSLSAAAALFGVGTDRLVDRQLLFVLRDHWILIALFVLLVTGVLKKLLYGLLEKIPGRGVKYMFITVVYAVVFYFCMTILLGTEPVPFFEIYI